MVLIVVGVEEEGRFGAASFFILAAGIQGRVGRSEGAFGMPGMSSMRTMAV